MTQEILKQAKALEMEIRHLKKTLSRKTPSISVYYNGLNIDNVAQKELIEKFKELTKQSLEYELQKKEEEFSKL